jgi:hypothetical protein
VLALPADFWLDCLAMRRLLLLCLSGAAITAQAQGWEYGARYWVSSGETVRSHNAQGSVPSLGNPTSVLTYENLTAHAVELHARRGFGERWFLRGNFGLGWVRKGWFDDEDFNAGQVKFSDSTSVVRGNQLTYFTIDIGRDLWAFGAGGTLGLFGGLQQWRERLDAYGAVFTVGGPGNVPDSVRVITNEVTWNSLRVGVAANARFSSRTRLSADVAWVPLATVRDEDSHYLRGDLGPVPNILMKGDGHGVQLDLELRHLVSERWELGAGFRYWWLKATSGNRYAAGSRVPLRELESQRAGLTFSITRRF